MQTSHEPKVSNSPDDSTQPIVLSPSKPDLPINLPPQFANLPDWVLVVMTVIVLAGRLTQLTKQLRQLLLTLYWLMKKLRKKPEKPKQ